MIITLKQLPEGSTAATCRTRSEICQVAELYSWRICASGSSSRWCGSITISIKPSRLFAAARAYIFQQCSGLSLDSAEPSAVSTVNSSICCSWQLQFSDRWTGGTILSASSSCKSDATLLQRTYVPNASLFQCRFCTVGQQLPRFQLTACCAVAVFLR